MPSHESRQWQIKSLQNFPTVNNVSKSTNRWFKTQHISHFDVRTLLDDRICLCQSILCRSLTTQPLVTCVNNVILIKTNNSHFSHFFLLAALLLSAALSHKALIRTAAELTQHSWRLGTLYSACPHLTLAKCIYQVCKIWMD